MDVKGTLKAVTLELRRELDGRYDTQGTWHSGDLERRLASIGVWRDREPKPLDELPRLVPDDREARRLVDAFLESRREAGRSREDAIAEFVRDAAYTWANRLLALRCMEARGLIDEVILQKDAYGGRSLQHNRLAKKQPERCAGEDEGLFATLSDEFARRAEELPLLFDPRVPEVALRPSVAALKRCVSLLSGTSAVKGQEAATDEVFTAPDALGWTYQYWDAEEKDRVFEKVRTQKGFKIKGADIIPATCIYTEPYMVRFLVQNSLGAMWMGMHPDSRLVEKWEYYVRGADRASMSKKPVADITLLDPACGSGHFLIEAFELFYAMYLEEGALTDPAEICASILERNLYGIDIDERAVQIAALALVMKAKEKAPDFVPRRVNLVATNIRLPSGREHIEAFLQKYPEDAPLKPALLAIFDGLAHVDELGSLLQVDEPVEKELRALKEKYEGAGSPMEQQTLWREFEKPIQGKLPIGVPSYEAWKERALTRIRDHFDADARDTDLGTAFFGKAASKGLSLVEMISRRYDVVTANPPYLGIKKQGDVVKEYLAKRYPSSRYDTFSAFMARALSLANDHGMAAVVVQRTWLFLNYFRVFRQSLLDQRHIRVLVDLGEKAFFDSTAAGAFVVMAIIGTAKVEDDSHVASFIDCSPLVGPAAKEEELRRTLVAARGPLRVLVSDFREFPESIFNFSTPPELRKGIAQLRPLSGYARVTDSVVVVQRFVRFWWETPQNPSRWHGYSKGGGYARWAGLDFYSIDWEHAGVRLKAYVLGRYPPSKFRLIVKSEDTIGEPCVTWTTLSRGSFGARLLLRPAIVSSKGPGIFRPDSGWDLFSLAGLFNSRIGSYLMRAISPGLEFGYKYVEKYPMPSGVPSGLATYARSAHDSAVARRSMSLIERGHHPLGVWQGRRALFEAVKSLLLTSWELALSQLSAERDVEVLVANAYGLSPAALSEIYRAVGAPLATELASASATVGSTESESLRRWLREIGAPDDEHEKQGDETDAPDEDGDVDRTVLAAPLPTDSLLEECCRSLSMAPESAVAALRGLDAGFIKESEVGRNSTLEILSEIVLRLLGHCWPPEIEAARSPPTWADKSGIIPLTEGTSEPGLIARVRERLAEDFGADRAGVVEREFQEIVGKPLAAWLASDFFKRHISQFRKRPIAWQLASTATSNVKRRGRGAGQTAPAFACLIYYHRLNADLLPKLRTQYVGPLRTSLQTELGSLDKLKQRSADQDARRVELERKLSELTAFDARLEQVLTLGFASLTLDTVAAKEPLDKWCSREGRAPASETVEAFLAQERRYDPDLNDGVRVNIAPLQRAGLLTADVLAAKDVEKAIADRAEWRADERRWCRERKLPQPGWWSTALPENHVAAERTA